MISGLVFFVFVTAFCSLIVALQVKGGFPPFYFVRERYSFWTKPIDYREAERRREQEEDIEKTVKALVPLFGLLVLGFGLSFAGLQSFGATVLLLASLYIFWYVSKLRSEVRDRSGGVEYWLVYPITQRFPMLVFDIWVFGLSLMFGMFGFL